jgi:DNA-binding transcriptional LysR family regulator
MELRQLRAFAVVAEERHFVRAAERLGIAQPSLSQQIRRLEDELGVELLIRTSRRLELTEAGRAFLLRAREALDHADVAVAAARRASRGDLGHLRIGTVDWALSGILPAVLRAFRADRPGVTTEVRDLAVARQVAELQDGRLDVAFVHAPLAADGLSTQALETERLVALVPADHPLAARPVLGLEAVAAEPLVLRTPAAGGGARAAVLELFARHGCVLRVAQEPEGLDAVLALVAAGTGLSVQPEPVVAMLRDDVVARPLEGSPRTPRLELAWRASEPSAVIAAFAATTRRVAAGARPAALGAAPPVLGW